MIKELLGHEDIRTTQIYLGSFDDPTRDAVYGRSVVKYRQKEADLAWVNVIAFFVFWSSGLALMDWVGWPPPDRVVNLIVVIVWGWVSWHLGRGVVYFVIKIKAAKE